MGIKGEMSGTICVTFTWDMYIYIWVVYSLCCFCGLFTTVTWWYMWCIEWASGNQEEVQACLVTLWLFIISCYILYKTTLGLLCSWFENNPHFHKYRLNVFSCLMCLFRLFLYEKYDWSNHSMIKCKFKKVNNWTTTTYRCFWLHNQWGNNACSLLHESLESWG